MLFGFKWWKKKDPPRRPAYMNVEEIIRTTARTRSSLYQDWGLGYTAYEDIATEVFDKYLSKWANQKLTNNIIDEIQSLFQQAETKQILIAEQWKTEYGM